MTGPTIIADTSPTTSAEQALLDDDADQKMLEEELFLRRKRLIQTSWRAVQFGLDTKATEIFYGRLFEQYPSVRPMFKDDMTSQYDKLYAAVSVAVRFLDNVDELIPVLEDLGVRHASYGVVSAHYEAVTECFLWTLNSYILSQMPGGNAINWRFEVSEAWEWALTFIGKTMADAADEAVEANRRAKQAEKALS